MKFMTNSVSVGIDILDLRNMPNYFGRNEKRFFKDNYSKSEIDSILKKNDIRKYFGILFSLKESIVKCEKKYLGQLFNEIEIKFHQNMLMFDGLEISYSHSGNLIITTAIKTN